MARSLDLGVQFLTFMRENAFDEGIRSAKYTKMGILLPLPPSPPLQGLSLPCKDLGWGFLGGGGN